MKIIHDQIFILIRGDPALSQQSFDVADGFLKHPMLPDGIPHPTTRLRTHTYFRRFKRNIKGNRNRQVCFVQIRDVIDERTICSGMDESQPRRAPQSNYDCMNHTIERRVSSR